MVVTAENGSKRTYVLKVTVKEYEPILVKVDNEEYNVVRKRKGLPVISEYFTEQDITVGEEIVEGYYNETLDYDVVGLKDNTGNIKYISASPDSPNTNTLLKHTYPPILPKFNISWL